MRYIANILAVTVVCFGMAQAKAQVDGKKLATCAIHSAHSCSPGIGCGQIPPSLAALPNFVSVDFSKSVVVPLGNPEDKRTSKIKSTATIDGKIMVQGIEDGATSIVDGAGWTASIDKKSGAMVVTMASAPDSLVLFGACIAK